MFDMLVRGGIIVRPEGLLRADLGVKQGCIAAIGADMDARAAAVVDASGFYVFPGLIDVHVHFNEPGRTDWEGFAAGSRALAAGGGTTYFDMPLNSRPPVLDRPSLEEKRRAAEASSTVDFALWGGLTPRNLEHLPELAEGGVIGFKAFLSDSGLPEFPPTDDFTLYEGMRIARELDLPVAVHAENEGLVRGLTRHLTQNGRGPRQFLQSRPVLAEVEAVQRALLFARETGVRLHIAHVSCGAALQLIAEAKAAGVDVTFETCPHYLIFTEGDVERLGAVLKCAPPLRGASDQDALWQGILGHELDMIASDHSPSPPSMKQGDDFFAIWGGIAGAQSTLVALLTEGLRRGIAPEQLAPRLSQLLSDTPARRFRLTRKGRIDVGYDADFTLVAWNGGRRHRLASSHLFQRHPETSPYIGAEFCAEVTHTVLRGRTLFHRGEFDPAARGRFLKPEPPSMSITGP